MDKNTLSNYGWIVIAVLVLSVMIALATPFGSYIEQGVRATTEGLFSTSQNAMNTAFGDLGVEVKDQTFEQGYQTPLIDMSIVDKKILANNDWETIQAVVKSGRIKETDWKVGDISPEFVCDDKTYTAKIIGINQDGENTITFLFTTYIDIYKMNETLTNSGGYASSALKTTIDNLATKMSNANYIKTVTKISNIGYDNPQGTSENDCKLFILSVKEIGLTSEHSGSSTDAISINSESKFTYQYFENITKISEFAAERWFWLRTATTDRGDCFRLTGKDNRIHTDYAYYQYGLLPAFVIG